MLGLNGRKLAEALKEHPHLTDSPDTRGNTPLIWAATRGDKDDLQELLRYGASTGWDALYAPVNSSRLDCTAALLVVRIYRAQGRIWYDGPASRLPANRYYFCQAALRT